MGCTMTNNTPISISAVEIGKISNSIQYAWTTYLRDEYDSYDAWKEMGYFIRGMQRGYDLLSYNLPYQDIREIGIFFSFIISICQQHMERNSTLHQPQPYTDEEES